MKHVDVRKSHRSASPLFLCCRGNCLTAYFNFFSHHPGSESTKLDLKLVNWKFTPYDDPMDISLIFDNENFLLNEKTYDLTVADLTLHDSGRYRCAINNKTIRVYDLQVVENDKTVTVSLHVRRRTKRLIGSACRFSKTESTVQLAYRALNWSRIIWDFTLTGTIGLTAMNAVYLQPDGESAYARFK